MPLLCLCLVRFKPYTSLNKSPMSASGVPTLAEISFFVVSGMNFLLSPSRRLSEWSSSSSIYSNSLYLVAFKITMFDAESFALGGCSCRACGVVLSPTGVSIDFGYSVELSMLGDGVCLFIMKPGPVYGPICEGYTELALTNFILGKPPVGKPSSLSMVAISIDSPTS